MKIVLLESLGISQELLDSYVKPLKEKGYEFAAYERNDDLAVQIEEAKDADILIIANMPLKAEVINACPNLKYIDVAFTGVECCQSKRHQSQQCIGLFDRCCC